MMLCVVVDPRVIQICITVWWCTSYGPGGFSSCSSVGRSLTLANLNTLLLLLLWCFHNAEHTRTIYMRACYTQTRGHIKGDGTQCGYCKKSSGGLITCSYDGCKAAFHAPCVKPWGGSSVRGPHLHPRDWTARCPKHAVVKTAAKGGSGSGLRRPVMLTAPMPVKEMYK